MLNITCNQGGYMNNLTNPRRFASLMGATVQDQYCYGWAGDISDRMLRGLIDLAEQRAGEAYTKRQAITVNYGLIRIANDLTASVREAAENPEADDVPTARVDKIKELCLACCDLATTTLGDTSDDASPASDLVDNWLLTR